MPTHTIIAFGGWGGGSDRDLGPNPTSGTGMFLERAHSLEVPEGDLLSVHGFSGELSQNVGIMAAQERLRENYDPDGKLIVYGYSAGGLSALRFTHSIWAAMPAFDPATRRFSRHLWQGNATRSGNLRRVRVDFLATIDAASGPMSDLTPRRVFPSVAKNFNVYQTHNSPIWSNGGPTRAFDPEQTEIENRNWSYRYEDDPESAHRKIDEDSLGAVVSRIRDLFG